MITHKLIFRDQIVRAVTGGQPAMVFHVVKEAALGDICDRLVEAEQALSVLRAKGYGKPGMLLHEVAALVPERIKP